MSRLGDKPIELWSKKVVRGNVTLLPANDFAWDRLRALKVDQLVEMVARHRRDGDRHMAYWATLRDCVEGTGCASNAAALHLFVKKSVGLVETILLADQTIDVVPGSEAYDKMSETEMIAFFEQANEVLARCFHFSKVRP